MYFNEYYLSCIAYQYHMYLYEIYKIRDVVIGHEYI